MSPYIGNKRHFNYGRLFVKVRLLTKYSAFNFSIIVCICMCRVGTKMVKTALTEEIPKIQIIYKGFVIISFNLKKTLYQRWEYNNEINSKTYNIFTSFCMFLCWFVFCTYYSNNNKNLRSML